MSTWNYADVWEAVADALPGSGALTHGGETRTWAELDRRADNVARWLLGAHVAYQDKVALYLHNGPEYLETSFASFKLGLVPINTNYRYAEDELVYLWENADAVAVVFHGVFAERIEALRPRVPGIGSWLWVDDGTASCPTWAVPYEEAAETTGATTGEPARVARTVGPRARRPLHALHGWHDRTPERRHVAPGRPLRAAQRRRVPPLPGGRHSRPSPRRARARRIGHDPSAGLPADARDRRVHRARVPERRRPGGDPGVPPLRPGRTARGRRARAGQRSGHRRRRVRQAHPRRARCRSRPLRPLESGRDGLLGGDVERRDQTGTPPPSPGHAARRRVLLLRGPRDGHVGLLRQRCGAVPRASPSAPRSG